METLAAASRWLAKQHVVTWRIHHESELWYANVFYPLDVQKMVFHVLTEERARHAQMSGPRVPIAGIVNGQSGTVALIRGVQSKGEIRRLERQESKDVRKTRDRCFPVVRTLPAPVQEIQLDEVKFTDNTSGFGRKMYWLRDLQLEK